MKQEQHQPEVRTTKGNCRTRQGNDDSLPHIRRLHIHRYHATTEQLYFDLGIDLASRIRSSKLEAFSLYVFYRVSVDIALTPRGMHRGSYSSSLQILSCSYRLIGTIGLPSFFNFALVTSTGVLPVPAEPTCNFDQKARLGLRKFPFQQQRLKQ